MINDIKYDNFCPRAFIKYFGDFRSSIKNFGVALLLALQFDLAWKIEIYMDLILASTDGAARRAGISSLMRFNISLDKENPLSWGWGGLENH